jgi:ornithine cyclodeaminase/alanine dehydrogenase-like protein (mu-crystallin family)
MTDVPYLNAADVFDTVGYADAVGLLQEALRDGLEPASDPARTIVDFRSGQLLLMPTEHRHRAGVKVNLVAEGNAARGLGRIQGVYVLLDSETFVPLATMDAPALTELRTAAVSVAAVEPVLAARGGPLRVAVIGRGVQARGHAHAVADTFAGRRPVTSMVFLGRSPEDRPPLHLDGISCSALQLGSAQGDEALAAADLVLCCTTAGTPLFDSALLRDDVVVTAVGSHEPHKRELDTECLRRADVVVEDVATALREAGDVIQAIDEGALDPARLVPMSDVVAGRVRPGVGRPVVFKGTGMSWQDLVVGEAVFSRWMQAQGAVGARR